MAEENNNGTGLRQEEQTEINFSDIWGMIWGNRWWYVLSLAVCIVFAGFYLYRTPGTYSRSAKLIINEDAQDATLRDIANISGFAGQGASVNVNNEVEAFSSPDLMATVVERLGLFDRTIGAVGDGLQGDVKHPYIVRQRGCCLLLGLCQVFCVRLAGGDENGLISGGESLL